MIRKSFRRALMALGATAVLLVMSAAQVVGNGGMPPFPK